MNVDAPSPFQAGPEPAPQGASLPAPGSGNPLGGPRVPAPVPAMNDGADSILPLFAKARLSQGRWAVSPLASRLQVVRRARHLFAASGLRLAEASAACRQRPAAEALTAEVLPLAAACRFLERAAARLLRPRRPGILTRPAWLGGVHSEVRREPFGVVLVIGPGNYPLLLAGVQALQALVAGNAVLLKPAPGSAAPVRLFVDLLVCGLA